MLFKQTQKSVDKWISQFEEGYFPPHQLMTQLSEEVGEIAREVSHKHGLKKKKKGEPKGDLGKEIADAIFALVCPANSEGIDLDKKFAQIIKKFNSRDKKRWTRKK